MAVLKIVLSGDAKTEFDATLRREYPDMDIQRARVYEKEADQFEVHLQVSGKGRMRGREVIKPGDPECTKLYNTLLPTIHKAKQNAATMRENARPAPPSGIEDYLSEMLWAFDFHKHD